MEREIKFRAKGEQSDEWCFGNLVDYGDGEVEIHGFDVFRDGNDEWREIKVIPQTIGQFTGLYDRNKNAIYEDDIVKWNRNNRLCLVKFQSGGFYGSVEEFGKGTLGGFPLYALTECEDDEFVCEVIGNIFDDKELLED